MILASFNLTGEMCIRDRVEMAEVSHDAGTAIVTLSADVSDEILTKAVEDKDYKVLSVA